MDPSIINLKYSLMCRNSIPYTVSPRSDVVTPRRSNQRFDQAKELEADLPAQLFVGARAGSSRGTRERIY